MAQNIDNVDKGINWLTKLLELSKKYSILNWIETFTVLFILGVMLSVFTHPKEVLEYFQREQQEEHAELMEMRRQNNSEIQKIADKMLYTTGASRAVLLELHNGANSSSGIPFLRTSCTFEALNDDVYPIAGQYQGVSLSLIPFLSYLYEKTYWEGKTADMQNIDKSLSYRMRSNNTEYFAAEIIQGVNGPIGYIILSFEDPEKVPEGLEALMHLGADQTALLLELRKS